MRDRAGFFYFFKSQAGNVSGSEGFHTISFPSISGPNKNEVISQGPIKMKNALCLCRTRCREYLASPSVARAMAHTWVAYATLWLTGLLSRPSKGFLSSLKFPVLLPSFANLDYYHGAGSWDRQVLWLTHSDDVLGRRLKLQFASNPVTSAAGNDVALDFRGWAFGLDQRWENLPPTGEGAMGA